MNKAIFGSALLCTVFLIIGTYAFPTDLIMWFASTSVVFTIFRVVMAGMLLAVLATNPPRHIYMRIAMGSMSLALTCLGLGMFFTDSLHILDVVLFMVLAAAFGLEALEFNEVELEEKVVALREQYVDEHAVPATKQFKAIASQVLASSS